MRLRTRLSIVIVVALAAAVASAVALASVNAVTFDKTASLSADHTVATVTGQAQCTGGDDSGNAAVTAEVLQSKGQGLNIGVGSSTIACDGTTQSYSVLVPVQAGQYQPGRATVLVDVSYFNGTTGDFSDKSVTGSIHLTK